jgi:hypothetical protein
MIKTKPNMMREIPPHLVKPHVEISIQPLSKIIPVKNIRSAAGRPLPLKEKKFAVEE